MHNLRPGSIALKTHHSNDDKDKIIYCYGPYIFTKTRKVDPPDSIEAIHVVKEFENEPQIVAVEISEKLINKLRYGQDYHYKIMVTALVERSSTFHLRSAFYKSWSTLQQQSALTWSSYHHAIVLIVRLDDKISVIVLLEH